ncbi:MAG: hypothetical protein V4520_20335 [Bacteroidota bacterium]
MPIRPNDKRVKLGYQFESLCQQIFIAHNFTIQVNQLIEKQNFKREADITFQRGDLNGVAEIK